MAWIKSAKFSPRARAQAYDSMRRLAYSATPTPATYNMKHVKSSSEGHSRPQSASPRLRNKENNTAILSKTDGVDTLGDTVSHGGMHLDTSYIQRPSTASDMYA